MEKNLNDFEADMQQRHIKEALALQEMALKKFQTINPEKLSNSEMVRFLTAGASLERLARKSSNPQKDCTYDVLEDLKKVKSFFDEQ